ncbi:hypothetical protein LTS08_004168 [Lithohypha guttulata]|nr:hypothetical protein LTR51_005726 [Lithohypha guttulata]KAK5101709.1 hypothetical protein LTS08_004168 [Lithohypha guttulata]
MHYTKLAILAFMALAAARPPPPPSESNNSGDTTTTITQCSNEQATMCCDQSGKNCEVSTSCNNNALVVCGNTISVPVTVDARGIDFKVKMTRRAPPPPPSESNDSGDTTTTVTKCSNDQSTVCCNESGKDCEIKDSCNSTALVLCGNTVNIPINIGL